MKETKESRERNEGASQNWERRTHHPDESESFCGRSMGFPYYWALLATSISGFEGGIANKSESGAEGGVPKSRYRRKDMKAFLCDSCKEGLRGSN